MTAHGWYHYCNTSRVASSMVAVSNGRMKSEDRGLAPPNRSWLGLMITLGGGKSWTRLDGRVLLMLSQKYSSSVSTCMHTKKMSCQILSISTWKFRSSSKNHQSRHTYIIATYPMWTKGRATTLIGWELGLGDVRRDHLYYTFVPNKVTFGLR